MTKHNLTNDGKFQMEINKSEDIIQHVVFVEVTRIQLKPSGEVVDKRVVCQRKVHLEPDEMITIRRN